MVVPYEFFRFFCRPPKGSQNMLDTRARGGRGKIPTHWVRRAPFVVIDCHAYPCARRALATPSYWPNDIIAIFGECLAGLGRRRRRDWTVGPSFYHFWRCPSPSGHRVWS